MIMLSNVKNYICENIDELLSIKTAYLIFVTAMMIVFAIGCIYLMNRHTADVQYIEALEGYIENVGVADTIRY